MKTTSFSAPGKAVLCGEYAVLRGAPAVSVAVNCRARVTVSQVAEKISVVCTLGFAEGSYRFQVIGECVEWVDRPPGGVSALLKAVFDDAGVETWQPMALTIDTRPFFTATSGKKLGLGSSAAATVALSAALQKRRPEIANIWTTAAVSHKKLQGGRGSGIDIATSCFGGLITYKSDDEAPPKQNTWPAGLFYQFFYSGMAADTIEAIDRVDGIGEGSWTVLVREATNTAMAWQSRDVKKILRAMEKYTDSLREFDLLYGLSIFGGRHQELVDLARTASLVYKPCGAGGGDIGVALSTTKEELQMFAEHAHINGFMPLDLETDNNGVMPVTGENA